MIDAFDALLCLLQNFVSYVLRALMLGVNGIVQGLADAIAAVVPYLPSLPDWPTGGDWTWLNWVAPVSTIVSLGTTLLGIYLGFFGFRIALRWAKAL